jgi:hypothetical protein
MKTMNRARVGVVAAFALCAAALVAAGSASATSLTVCPSGCPYTTISAALVAASDGDKIVVGSGTYVERVTIDEDVSLLGAGAAETTLSGPPAGGEVNLDPVVRIEAQVSASISGLTITGGDIETSGGGVQNFGDLTLTRSAVVGNSAIFDGGSVYNVGSLAISNSTIEGVAGHNLGGGIFNSGALTISKSSVSGRALDCCGGAIANVGMATLKNSMINDSFSWGPGGGIANFGSGEMTLTNVSVSDNEATEFGGGGGIVNDGTMMLLRSAVTGNQADGSGGGILNHGGLTLDATDVTDNAVDLEPSGFGGNGGGIFNSGTLVSDHSHVTGNTAALSGGGLFNSPEGSLSLTKTSISGNTPDDCIGCSP